MTRDEIAEAWRKLLLEAVAARNYWQTYMMYGLHTHRHVLLEQFLPALLHIKAVTILDDALEFWIAARELTLPGRYRDSLQGRIDFLCDQEILPQADRGDLHRIRRRRNALAHSTGELATWEELDRDHTRMHDILQAAGLVDPPKALEFYWERSAMRDSTRAPEYRYERDFEYGVKEEGTPVLHVNWTQHLGGLGQ